MEEEGRTRSFVAQTDSTKQLSAEKWQLGTDTKNGTTPYCTQTSGWIGQHWEQPPARVAQLQTSALSSAHSEGESLFWREE